MDVEGPDHPRTRSAIPAHPLQPQSFHRGPDPVSGENGSRL